MLLTTTEEDRINNLSISFILYTGQFEANGRLVPGTKCDYRFLSANYTAAEGRFFSPRYPSSYPHNSKCSYYFHARLVLKSL